MTRRIAPLCALLLLSVAADAKPGVPRGGGAPAVKPKPAPKPAPPAPPPPKEEVVVSDADSILHAGLAPNGDEVRLITEIGGKKPTATLQIGKNAATKLFAGDSVGALETAHGKLVVALAITHSTAPFRIFVDGKETKLNRPGKRYDLPFAMAMTSTPTGFTVFFQEIEPQNTNEAHTYMAKLDKAGKPDGELKEVQVPWWIGDAAWNGKGYQMALYYAGEQQGARLSMVSLTADGTPEQHPDWASQPGQLSDMNLVSDDKKILAYYRGGAGDRLMVTDVTTIGQWGGAPKAGKDLGALDGNSAIAINSKGQPVKVKRAAK